jgi:hypothetical protein
MVTVDIYEVVDRLNTAQAADEVCLLHPRESEELVDFVFDIQREHDRAEWIWILMYMVVFWAGFFFLSGGRLAPPP